MKTNLQKLTSDCRGATAVQWLIMVVGLIAMVGILSSPRFRYFVTVGAVNVKTALLHGTTLE